MGVSVQKRPIVLAAPQAAAEGEITLGVVFVFPVMYALVGLIFVPIGCVLIE